MTTRKRREPAGRVTFDAPGGPSGGVPAQLGSSAIWTRAQPGGDRPRFTRDEIAAAAMRIADTEGFHAVSMRRLATELGAGTMTLYHYLRTKDELLTLVNDAVMAEVVVPPDEALPAGWREALTVIARRTRAAMLRHPWVLDVADDPPLGPNSIRHLDQSLQAVAGLGVSLEEQLDIVATVDEYVFGHFLHERRHIRGQAFAGAPVEDYGAELIASGDFPQLAALVDERGFDGVWAAIGATFADDGRFERNLGRVLDGIEAGLAR